MTSVPGHEAWSNHCMFGVRAVAGHFPRSGKKFDAKAYQDEMFARMIERAKTADADLAERLSTQQRHHELVVSEN